MYFKVVDRKVIFAWKLAEVKRSERKLRLDILYDKKSTYKC